RHDVHALGDRPCRADLERLLATARDSVLPPEEIALELTEIEAALEGLAVSEQIERSGLPIARAADPPQLAEQIHFTGPVRFGRRRTDQLGHLQLMSRRLTFRGALDLSIAWIQVRDVRRDDQEIVVGLAESDRLL